MKVTKLKTNQCHSMNKTRIDIEISLDDDCKNGHADFSITATGYEKARNNRWVETFGGCCHDEILKIYPQFQIFVDLHLSDCQGIPMYAVENGFYHAWDKDKTLEQRQKTTMEYLRITKKEYKALTKAKDKNYFKYMIEKLKLLDKWKKQANKAIGILEKLTNNKWDYSYKWERISYIPLTKSEKQTMKERIVIGYYIKKAIKVRRKRAEERELERTIKNIQIGAKKDIIKINKKALVKEWIIRKVDKFRKKHKNFIIDTFNIIYYGRVNELCFNWVGRNNISLENFDLFCLSITKADLRKLPKGIKFTIKG